MNSQGSRIPTSTWAGLCHNELTSQGAVRIVKIVLAVAFLSKRARETSHRSGTRLRRLPVPWG